MLTVGTQLLFPYTEPLRLSTTWVCVENHERDLTLPQKSFPIRHKCDASAAAKPIPGMSMSLLTRTITEHLKAGFHYIGERVKAFIRRCAPIHGRLTPRKQLL